MSAITSSSPLNPPGPAPRQGPLVPTGVMGVILLILCEIMMFAAFLSAHQIARANLPEWPPPGQPRLPVGATLINTVFLLLSGILLFVVHRTYRDETAPASRSLFTTFGLAILFGGAFLVLQGREWVQLVTHGLTYKSSAYGSYFYLIVGAHALHVLAGLGGLCLLYTRLIGGTLTCSALWAGETFWYFVVGLWPVLYVVLYLT